VNAVPSSRTVIVEGEPRFPKVVAAELIRRRQAVLADTKGRVLDLSDPEAREHVRQVIDGENSTVIAEWDQVVSIADLIRFPDLSATLGAIDQLLVPSGRLLAVEPVARPGTLRVISTAPWSATTWLRGVHIGRDLIAALRTTTLVNDDIERFTVSTSVLPLRHFVSLGARRVEHTTEVIE
jgi:hypothetical protein